MGIPLAGDCAPIVFVLLPRLVFIFSSIVVDGVDGMDAFSLQISIVSNFFPNEADWNIKPRGTVHNWQRSQSSGEIMIGDLANLKTEETSGASADLASASAAM